MPCGAPRARSQEVYDDECLQPSLDLSSFSPNNEVTFDTDTAERLSQEEKDTLQALQFTMNNADEENEQEDGENFRKNHIDIRKPLVVSDNTHSTDKDINL